VYLYESWDNTLSSNIMVNNGIYISGNAVEYWRHNITSDNLVNGKQLGYFWSCTGGIIDGVQFGQVILANCTGVTVADSVFSNASVGIALGYSSYCSLKNNTMSGIDDGVYLSSSSNNTIVNNTISGNGVGVRIHYSSDNNAVVNNTISGKHRGVYIFASSDNSVVNNVISGSSFGGMSIHFSSSNNTVVNNTISGNGIGVWLYESSNNTVVGNTISGNYADGVYLYSSSDNTLVNNTISGNSQSGVSIFSSSDNTLVNNTISGNNNTGVSIWTPSSDNLIYLNVIADNNNGNAYDDGTDNHWNITGRGNYWSDHTGTGVYHIPGSAGSIDYYPFIYPPETTTPTIDQPASMNYVEGITGNTITWTPSDEHPSHYVVYRNGTVVVLANWDESSITVEVDGLSVGVYNYTIVVYDTSGNWASDTVLIIVLSQTTTTSTTITNGDVTSLVILFLGVGGIGVVIVVLILMRHRRGSMTGL
jgi:parallel beta-helix repeat protein